jgi:hypothetical protein
MTPGELKNFAPEGHLALLLKKSPEAAAKFQVLIQENPSFQSLCEDYRDCLAALEHWQAATSTEAPEVVQSYVELLQELEQEVRQYLEDETASRIDRPC